MSKIKDYFNCFVDTSAELFHSVVDDIGDSIGTSGFARERKLWKNAMNYNLTREVYNANKKVFNFRHDDEMQTLAYYRTVGYNEKLEMAMSDNFIGLNWPKAMNMMEEIAKERNIQDYDMAA